MAMSNSVIHIDVATQQLFLTGVITRTYSISTALNGVGEQEGSGCTPRGQHIIANKIGADHAMNSVFVGRIFTGEIYHPELAALYPQRDWILSRILWLSGVEPDFNQGEGCDSHQRYIYIHGTPDSEPMGVARSHGCIRMRNTDVIELFDLVDEGTQVNIVETRP
jgi:L,D-transpeptidase YbiS